MDQRTCLDVGAVHGGGRVVQLAVRLSGMEMLACWDALDLGPPPALLPLFSPATTHGEHQRRREEVLAGLAVRGLAEAGRPHPGLAAALRLLARPEYRLDLRYGDGPARMIVGVGAVSGAAGVVVVSDGSDRGPFELYGMDSVRVAGSLLQLLGPIQRGVGRPVNIPADLLDHSYQGAHGDLWAMADRLQHHGVARLDATSLTRMVTGIRAGGQLGVTVGAQRGRWVIGFHATSTGWFLQLRRPDHHRGRPAMVTVCPTDTAELHRQWTDLLTHTKAG
jgi:hypothetical protein